ncbi:MAG: hypothetical protein FRX48_03506 [Lasallia pustulata]|uniref:Uncharacterized protein n=1 Tax=Lasallia pustulata TaxID=136370 RepID=A0A5M8PU27_9LECA|nr:MAG: hypothetical protein FRX48_03506 [Lasallia pustulata]
MEKEERILTAIEAYNVLNGTPHVKQRIMQLSKAATKAIADRIILEHRTKALAEANIRKGKRQTRYKKAYTGLGRVLVVEDAKKPQEAEEEERQTQLISQQTKKDLAEQRRVLREIKQLEAQVRKSKRLQDKEEKQAGKTAVVTAKAALEALKDIDPTALL